MNTLKLEFVNMVRSKKAQAEAKRYSKLCKIKREVKRNAIIITAITVVLTLITGCSAYHDKVGIFKPELTVNYYPRGFVITELDYDNDLVTMVDGADLTWDMEGCCDYFVGDYVCCVMSDNGTPDWIYDDEIVSDTYGGFEVCQDMM